MKNLITSLMVAALMAAPIGCERRREVTLRFAFIRITPDAIRQTGPAHQSWWTGPACLNWPRITTDLSLPRPTLAATMHLDAPSLAPMAHILDSPEPADRPAGRPPGQLARCRRPKSTRQVSPRTKHGVLRKEDSPHPRQTLLRLPLGQSPLGKEITRWPESGSS